jgi:hypothetical protein
MLKKTSFGVSEPVLQGGEFFSQSDYFSFCYLRNTLPGKQPGLLWRQIYKPQTGWTGVVASLIWEVG